MDWAEDAMCGEKNVVDDVIFFSLSAFLSQGENFRVLFWNFRNFAILQFAIVFSFSKREDADEQ